MPNKLLLGNRLKQGGAGMELENEVLIQNFTVNNDRHSFTSLVDRFQNFAYKIALYTCGRSAMAEEAAQEAFMYLWSNSKRFESRGTGSFQKWFYKVVVNQALMLRRKERNEKRKTIDETYRIKADTILRFRQVDSQNQNFEEKREDVHLLNQTLFSLPEKIRLPLVLFYLEGMQQTQISSILGISTRLIQRRISSGLKTLRQRMAVLGLSASLPVLENLLRNTTTPEMSDGLKEGLANICAGEIPTHIDGKDTVPLGSSTSIWPWLILGSVVLIFTVAWKTPPVTETQSTNTATIPNHSHQEKKEHNSLIANWNFNDEMPANIQEIMGGYALLSEGGIDNSGCIESGNLVSQLKFDLPMQDIPMLISLQMQFRPSNPLGENPSNAKYSISGLWEYYNQFGPFRNFLSEVRFDIKKSGKDLFIHWHPVKIYIGEKFIACYVAENFSQLTYIERKNNAKFVLFNKGPQRIDNLSIRRISQEELPDFTQWQKILDKIPAEKRIGRVNLKQFDSTLTLENPQIKFYGPGKSIDLKN